MEDGTQWCIKFFSSFTTIYIHGVLGELAYLKNVPSLVSSDAMLGWGWEEYNMKIAKALYPFMMIDHPWLPGTYTVQSDKTLKEWVNTS